MTHLKLMPMVAAFVVVLLVVVACGPASPQRYSGDGSRASNQETEPTATPGAPDKATPTPKPTLQPPHTLKPSPTPKVEPTRSAGDPPSPTHTPSGAPSPPSDDTSIDPHPEGLDGCRTISPYGSSLREHSYGAWCMTALMNDVEDACSGVGGGTADEKQCAVNRLSDVRSYMIRNAITPCAAVSDRDDREVCKQESLQAAGEHQRAFRAVWNEILLTVRDDAKVKETFRSMAQCVVDAGYEAPSGSQPFPWQEADRKRPNRERRDPDLVNGERLLAINQCSIDTGYYEEQEAVWRSELRRLAVEDMEKVSPLFEEGLHDIIDLPGPAPFLVLRQLEDNSR